jgi:hypothetical protein
MAPDGAEHIRQRCSPHLAWDGIPRTSKANTSVSAAASAKRMKDVRSARTWALPCVSE